MKFLLTLIFIFSFFHFYAGNGFLAKSGQFGINVNEIITQNKINLSYDYFVKRNYSFGAYCSFLNRDFSISNTSPSYSYIATKPFNGDKVTLQGVDFFIRFCHSSSFQNAVQPLGISYILSIGFTGYNIHETFDNINRTNSRFYLIYDLALRNTYHLWKGINVFYGINTGLVNTFSKEEDDDITKNVLRTYPTRGLNASIRAGNSVLNRLYFNINYGFTFSL